MTSGYETFDPPNTSAEADEAKAAAASTTGAQPPEAPPIAVVKEALGQSDPEPAELPDGERRFVSPKYRGGKFLAKAGELVMVPSPRGPWAKERVGDIWVDFKSGNGIFRTTDPVAIAWCEAHPEVCRDAFDLKTPAWVAVVEATLETATQAARLPANTDIDALLRGEASGLGGSDLVRRARGG